MPIQIKEIVVKATIEPNSENKNKDQNEKSLAAALAQIKEEIINECLDAVYTQERKNKDR